jgi:hypothetical protein
VRYDIVEMTPEITGDPVTWWAVIDHGGSGFPERYILARCITEERAERIMTLFRIYSS